MEETKSHWVLQRRYLVAFLGFLSAFVTQAQRLNVSMAMVDMVNSTNIHSVSIDQNNTVCPYMSKEGQHFKTVDPEFNWNPELQGYILSAAYLGYVLTQIPGGILASRFGTRPALIFSLTTASICNLLSPVAARQHPYLLAAVQFVRGMSQGLQPAAKSLLMAQWFPPSERGFLSTFICCGFPIGAVIGSIVSGPLCEMTFDGGWPLVFYTFGLFGIFVSVLFFYFYAERPADDSAISEKELHYILQYQSDSSIQRPPTPWKQLLSSVSTYALIIALFSQYWIAFYFLTVHPIYMGTILNIPIVENGLLSSGPHFAQAIAGFTACWLSLWLKRKNTIKVNVVRKGWITLSTVGYVIGMVGVYFAVCDTTLNLISIFIANASVGFNFAGCLIVAVDMSPTFCGVLMGFASTIASLAGFIVPVVVGKLTKDEQTLAQWQKMFLLTASVAAVSGISFLIFGSGNVQSYDPLYVKDENVKEPSKREDKSSTSDITSTKF